MDLLEIVKVSGFFTLLAVPAFFFVASVIVLAVREKNPAS